MDISRFDFELDEIVRLIPRLADLAQIIELEPRLHNADEDQEKVHSVRTEATFRISCQLGNDQSVSRLADLAVETGVEAVLDFGRSVRFRHVHPNEIAPPVTGQEPQAASGQDRPAAEEDRPATEEDHPAAEGVIPPAPEDDRP
jgi:hypothetical protein